MPLNLIKRCYRIGCGTVATTIMISVAPTYLIIHSSCRLMSIFLPWKFIPFFDDLLWGMYQKLVLFFFEHMTNVEIIISGMMPRKKENAILICNHQCSVDWVITDMIAERQNMIGNLRYIFKDSIKYMPLYGYAFGFHGGVYVKRDGSYNDKTMKTSLKRLINRNILTYFVVFPEGTRFSLRQTERLAKSRAFAVANDLRPLNQVLTPRVKAFHCTVNALRNYAAAVYDTTIVYEEKTAPTTPGKRYPAPNMWKFLLSPSPRIYIHISRIPLSEIPSTMDSTMSWLHSRFALKDALITQHFELKTGQDMEQQTVRNGFGDVVPAHDTLRSGALSKLPLSRTLPSAIFLTSLTALLMSTREGRIIYLTSLIGGSVLTVLYSKIFF